METETITEPNRTEALRKTEEDDLYERLQKLNQQLQFLNIQEEYIKDDQIKLKREEISKKKKSASKKEGPGEVDKLQSPKRKVPAKRQQSTVVVIKLPQDGGSGI